MSTTLAQLQQSMHSVRDARERRLPQRSADAIIAALAETARSWLAPTSPWRIRAIEQAPAATGFSPAMIQEIIDLTFGSITAETLGQLLDRELGNRQVLDTFCEQNGRRTRAHGPRLIAHVLAGNVPPPGILSICCGLLVKAANVVKVARRDPVFPTLFVESLRAVDPDLASCVAVLDWPRQETAQTAMLLGEADAVIAYGDDRTIGTLRQMTLAQVTFLGYGHKISFSMLTREAMTEQDLPALAEAAAYDVSVYDQQGCLSPHVIYVEERGPLGPRKFAAALAQAMGSLQLRLPRGTLTAEEAAAITQMRSAYEFRSASDRRIAVWSSPIPNDWTVIYEDDPSFTPSCLNRVVFVKPTDGVERVLESVRRFASQISTVGVAPLDEGVPGFASELAAMGIHRVCAIGQMQRPPLSWPHDGRPNLVALVRWTDIG